VPRNTASSKQPADGALNRRAFLLGAASLGAAFLRSRGRSSLPAVGWRFANAAGPARPSLPPSQRPSSPPVATEQTAAASAEQATAMPRRQPQQVVPRQAWTARGLAPNHGPMGAIGRITLHHSGVDHGGIDDLLAVRRIEHWHRDRLGWAGIGYHFVIGQDGRVIEGRPLAAQGAHVHGCNAGNVGVAVLGCYQATAPDPRQLAALSQLLDELRARHRIALGAVQGHRDLAATSCPGDQLYAWLRDYRRSAAA